MRDVRFPGVLAGSTVAVLSVLVPSLAQAQQESPLTSEMISSKAESTPPKGTDQTGSEFKDNPKWLIEQRKAEAEAERLAELEGKPVVQAKDEKVEPAYVPGYRRPVGIGLSPLAPQRTMVLPSGITPAPGAPSPSEEFRFDFHGYLQAGLRAGLGSRENALDGQKKTAMHGDPVVAGGAFGWFEHTNTVPTPWAQLNFEFGNEVISATAILAAWSLSQSDESADYFQPPSKLGFNDAYLTYTPKLGAVGLRMNMGVFTERYGAMGRYDSGAYGTSIIGTVYGVGASSLVTLPFDNDVTLSIEGSFKGDFNSPPTDIVSDQSNEYARAIEGSTYAPHAHLALDFFGRFEVAGHGIYAFSQDDRGDELEGQDVYLGDNPRRDGSLSIFGVDAKARLSRYGHLYVGASHVTAKDALTVSNVVQVLNNGPGRDLARRYFSFDSAGNGALTILGGQYDVSIGDCLRFPQESSGEMPDLSLSLFALYAKQKNEGEAFPDSEMVKAGVELGYSMTSWLALSGRVDGVAPDMSNMGRGFAVFTPKLIFRNDWASQATLTLQYSGYLLGDDVEVRGDERLLNNPSGAPDPHLLALYGTIWW